MGGQSTRMGSDKAFVKWQGETLLERAIAHMESVTSDLYLSVNEAQYGQLKTHYNCLKDTYPDKGPMGGILNALETLESNLLVMAVDMPLIDKKALEALVTCGLSSAKTCTYVDVNNFWQTLPSFWQLTDTAKLKSYFDKDQLALTHFLKTHGHGIKSDGTSTNFLNINNPSHLN